MVTLAKNRAVLQGVIGGPTETGRCCGMAMNVNKTKITKIYSHHHKYRIRETKNSRRKWNI